ncbi:hypothetical protein FACS189444_0110 [Spirochaetia bacterium]|nr:hypothetical protein FACS189444_0110 [Spirochaetia bacterium]
MFFIIGTCFPLINLFLNNISFFKGREIFLPVVELTGYIGYYVAGYYFATYELQTKAKTIINISAVVSLLFTIIVTSFVSIYKNEPVGVLYGYLLPTTMFIAYALFVFFKENYVKIKISQKMEMIIIKISKDTFGIYLIHALIIQIFGIIGINTLIINPILSIPVISIVVMVISYIGAIIIRKIPILKEYII